MAKEKKQKNADISAVRRANGASGVVLTVVFAVLSFLWICPILVVLLNSFKRKAYIFKNPFGLSTVGLSAGFAQWKAGLKLTFVGWLNYANAIAKTDFFHCFGYSLMITVGSVFLIILCCSMCAWYLVRVKNGATKTIYTLCLFSMIVPFQMVMFTLSKFANILHLSTPWGICIVYLGFGAGLAVFMFTGFIKSVPTEIEEAAMIDGCTPPQIFFRVDMPIMKPTIITVAILEAMWVWNDYLLPSLVLDVNKYKTIPIAVQFLKQSHGQIDWGAMMAVLVLAIVPIVIFYMICQKYIIEGVMAGAVKG
ncbi:MAG: carbohydrate ABC transporter permease [Lachnospiraceae bacterium]|jgi:raffinose/stachyose/melibiose transport system permease protein|nr:carbohydrate ABC transporter permease [Lachnospiraceae bacterium]MCH4063559.1 carbohydrate ABC transporter permease [Lachnospiraceae bacterium]MCI1551743.1 carbohydrate ABC transporter permease [Lachnospiraceae bacterium]